MHSRRLSFVIVASSCGTVVDRQHGVRDILDSVYGTLPTFGIVGRKSCIGILVELAVLPESRPLIPYLVASVVALLRRTSSPGE